MNGFVANGKEPDPFQAKSIEGTMYFFSRVIDTALVIKFKTGKPMT